MDVDNIRKDFPILNRKVNGKNLVYLDNAATTQKPIQVIEAVNNYYKEHNANIHRGVHQLSQEASELYEESHKKVAKFINAKSMEEIIFVRNATEAANLVSYAWASNLKEGDEILSTVMEHHANIVPWQFLKEKGIKINFVDITDDGFLNLDDLNEKITKKTKLITVTHASNVVGTINPVKEIGKIAHDNNAKFMIDAAQSVPHMKVDVKNIDCDFMIFSGHKMMAPMGSGSLYAKKEILDEMKPFLGGGDMIREVKLEKSTWNDLPWKFEAGTPDVGSAVGLSAAIDYINKIGLDNIRKHEIKLTKYALENLEENFKNEIEIYGPKEAEKRTGLIAFNLKKVHPHDVGSILDSEFGVAIRTGHHCAQPLTERLKQNSTNRASFYIYNKEEEIDIFIQGLKKVKQIFN
ncbi:MAG: cysteine desulfurase [Candidatus Woesearchaeota archaeon]